MTFFKVFGEQKKLFVRETKNFYFHPLNRIKLGPDERCASDFAFNSF